jgi:hypothetical protein
MFTPSLGGGPLTGGDFNMTRREHAQERTADLMAFGLDWAPPVRKPQPGFVMTRERIESNSLTRRVLFTGNFFMTDAPVAAWRPESPSEQTRRAGKTVGGMKGVLTEKGAAPPPTQKSSDPFAGLSLVPIDNDPGLELQSLQTTAGLELRIEVIKFSKPAANATGVTTGKMLAVSENYSAQHVGGNNVIVHENANLSRSVQPGEKVTLGYENGKATVFDGLAHDINISASWMPTDQKAYLRMVMFDALSQMTAPQNEDEKLRDALRFALESTANYFGLQETHLKKADICLVVNEKATVVKATNPELAAPSRRHP